jgi:hypothetical protein
MGHNETSVVQNILSVKWPFYDSLWSTYLMFCLNNLEPFLYFTIKVFVPKGSRKQQNTNMD